MKHEAPPFLQPASLGTRQARLWKLWRPVSLVLLLLGPLLALCAYHVASAYERERLMVVFEDVVAHRAQQLDEQVIAYIETLHACRGLFHASEVVTEDEFDTFTRGAIRRHPDILVLAWAPMQPASAQHDPGAGPPSGGAVSSSDGVQPHGSRPGATSAHVLRYVQPRVLGSLWRDQVLGVNPVRARALSHAVESHNPVLSDPHALPEAGGAIGAILMLAVGDGGTAAGGDEARARGVILLAFELRELIEVAGLRSQGSRSTLASLSLSDVAAGVHVASRLDVGVSEEAADLRIRWPLALANQRWTLEAQPTARFLTDNRRLGAWAIALAVFFVWECFAGFLLALGHALRAHVQERHARMVSHVVNSLTDGVVVTDPQGRVTLANPAARRLLGSPGPGVSDSGRWALGGCLLQPDGRTPMALDQQPLRRALQGEVVPEVESMVRSDEGAAPRWLMVSAAPVLDEHSRLDGGVLVLRDVSARRRLREKEVEMGLAADVQQRLYPRDALLAKGMRVAGAVMPAEETCGDYYDYYPLPDGRICLVIGDVSGHGFGPALVMAETRAYLRSLTGRAMEPGRILSHINELLVHDLAGELFVTLLVVIVDPDTGRLRYASAGQTPGLVLAADGTCRALLAASGPPLGLFEGREYPTRSGPPLAVNDTIVLMTDGATECAAPDGALLEERGVLAVAQQGITFGPEELLRRLQEAIRAHQGPGAPRDDVTFVVARLAAVQRAVPGGSAGAEHQVGRDAGGLKQRGDVVEKPTPVLHVSGSGTDVRPAFGEPGV